MAQYFTLKDSPLPKVEQVGGKGLSLMYLEMKFILPHCTITIDYLWLPSFPSEPVHAENSVSIRKMAKL